MVSHFRLLFWDIAVLKNGDPVLVEANLYDRQLDLYQKSNVPLFGDKTGEILDKIFV